MCASVWAYVCMYTRVYMYECIYIILSSREGRKHPTFVGHVSCIRMYICGCVCEYICKYLYVYTYVYRVRARRCIEFARDVASSEDMRDFDRNGRQIKFSLVM